MHMLHHVSLGVRDIEPASAFYDAVLAPLGYVRVWNEPHSGQGGPAIGYGIPGSNDMFALKQRTADAFAPGPGFHLAFAAQSRQAVEEFYTAAMRHGGKDNGRPGLRLQYGPQYFAAFVFDLDGYAIEAVIDHAT